MNKKHHDIKITPMQSSMLSAVAEIASMTLGSAFVDEEILKNDINLCAMIDTEIVAYATTKYIGSEYLKKILHDKELKELEAEKQVGYIDSIAVNENYAGKGIGTLLLKSTLLKLKQDNINYAIMAAWRNGTEVNIKALALREGFKEEFEIENFWKEDSIKHNFDCTACGKPPCLCSAVIFTKKL